MSKIMDIQEIIRIKALLEDYFKQYRDCKYRSEHMPKKRDRSLATDEMLTYASKIEKELRNPLIFSEISDGNSFQFENFWRYVNSDLPIYLEKIERLLERLKSEMDNDSNR